jgi:hypothetical protein
MSGNKHKCFKVPVKDSSGKVIRWVCLQCEGS